MSENTKELLNITELAEALDIPRGRVNRLLRDRKIPVATTRPHQRGPLPLFRVADVKKALEINDKRATRAAGFATLEDILADDPAAG